MDEASLCDRIALIQEGEFLKIDTPEAIVSQFKNRLWAAASDNMAQLLKDLRSYEATKNCFAFGDKHHVTISNLQYTIYNLQEYLQGLGHTNIQIFEIKPTIEDCFMELSQQ